MPRGKYVIGIDLGTTNCAVACVERGSDGAGRRRSDGAGRPRSNGEGEVRSVPILQRVSETQVAERRTLPSFLYLPGEHELPQSALSLPWAADARALVGEFARVQGARVPTRLVSSAKSWLCHPRADRTAPILPWDAPPDVERVSPVEASARYLLHMRESWNYQHGAQDRFQDQEIVLAVPASFNEVARELTVQAAALAGLENVTLLEEPQAAFYSWLDRHRDRWRDEVRDLKAVLVCDIGGGTTDFTLIRIEPGDPPTMSRVAVGEHLMLGGDNMDLALAHVMEQALGARFDSRSWGVLVHECRVAKEKLLAEGGPSEWTVTLPGAGSRLLGGMASAPLLREDVHGIVLEGFLPFTAYDESPSTARRSALAEWGLPYAADPAVSRHLSSFLRLQGGLSDPAQVPDAVLFNGAALEPTLLRDRILEVLGRWSGHHPREMPNRELDLAVARGAAYFGWMRESGGPRIGGGTARAYYVGFEGGAQERQAACLIPRGLEEGEEVEIREPEFRVLVDRPVAFPLYASSIRHDDRPGGIVRLDGDTFEPLPPLATVLGTRRKDARRSGRVADVMGARIPTATVPEDDSTAAALPESSDPVPTPEDLEERELPPAEIPVHLRARVTEIGTLELWCVGPEQKWRLQFQVRGADSPLGEGGGILPGEDPRVVRDCTDLITSTFKTRPGRLEQAPVKPRGLMWAIEERVHKKRDDWSLGFLRELWESLDRVQGRRRSGTEHEAAWLNMCGFTLRPGFGYPLDDWRVNRSFEVFQQGLQHPRHPAGRIEWWVLWRRLAGGLDRTRQGEVFAEMAPHLLKGRKHIKTRLGPPAHGAESTEFMRTVASLERLEPAQKIALGEMVVSRLRPGLEMWMLGRLGARVPLAASPHHCVPPEAAEGWLDAMLDLQWKDARAAGLAVVQVARLSGDRSRDLSERAREKAARRLIEVGMSDLARPLREVVELRAEEQAAAVGESIPIGLRL